MVSRLVIEGGAAARLDMCVCSPPAKRKGAVRGAVLMAALQAVICGQAAAGQRVDIDELKAALDDGATMLLIDVREDWEVASGSMPGSIHIPVAELERRMPDIPKDVRLVFF